MYTHCVIYFVPLSLTFIYWQLDLEARSDSGLIVWQENFIGGNMYIHTLCQIVAFLSDFSSIDDCYPDMFFY